jgi:hypothetical protein
MGERTRVLNIALLSVLLFAACEPKRSLVTQSGDLLTTESGDNIGSYTAPQEDYIVKLNP